MTSPPPPPPNTHTRRDRDLVTLQTLFEMLRGLIHTKIWILGLRKDNIVFITDAGSDRSLPKTDIYGHFSMSIEDLDEP